MAYGLVASEAGQGRREGGIGCDGVAIDRKHVGPLLHHRLLNPRRWPCLSQPRPRRPGRDLRAAPAWVELGLPELSREGDAVHSWKQGNEGSQRPSNWPVVPWVRSASARVQNQGHVPCGCPTVGCVAAGSLPAGVRGMPASAFVTYPDTLQCRRLARGWRGGELRHRPNSLP